MTIPRQGFTLIELLTALALISFLVVMSHHGFGPILQKQYTQNATSELIANLAFARSEAIKRNRQVNLCPKDSEKKCGNDWSKGYQVFDENTILRQVTLHKNLKIHSTNPNIITFNAYGQCLTRTTLNISSQRFSQRIVIYDSGRVRNESLS
ncbi:MAG: GspH/FimT family pseudopilin [Proteobacteria bacterium]|nr:GspH/FimT family pseudopilin [Pseudomonadota bacterium]